MNQVYACVGVDELCLPWPLLLLLLLWLIALRPPNLKDYLVSVKSQHDDA